MGSGYFKGFFNLLSFFYYALQKCNICPSFCGIITGSKGYISDGGIILDQVLDTCWKAWRAKLLKKIKNLMYLSRSGGCMHMHLNKCKGNLIWMGLHVLATDMQH